MESVGEIAVFNLDRTITEYVVGNAFLDAIEAGFDVPRLHNIQGSDLKTQRNALYSWLAGKSEEMVGPWLQVTSEKATERVAAWAKLVMAAEVELGSEICLYSSTTPEPLLEAYANGIEKTLPGVEVNFVYGKVLRVDQAGFYTGEAEQMKKARILEGLEDEGYTIEMAADSFNTAMIALKKAKKRFIVNPDRDLQLDEGTTKYVRIFWDTESPSQVEMSNRYQIDAQVYDLDEIDDRAELLEDLGYDEVIDDLDLEI